MDRCGFPLVLFYKSAMINKNACCTCGKRDHSKAHVVRRSESLPALPRRPANKWRPAGGRGFNSRAQPGPPTHAHPVGRCTTCRDVASGKRRTGGFGHENAGCTAAAGLNYQPIIRERDETKETASLWLILLFGIAGYCCAWQ